MTLPNESLTFLSFLSTRMTLSPNQQSHFRDMDRFLTASSESLCSACKTSASQLYRGISHTPPLCLGGFVIIIFSSSLRSEVGFPSPFLPL